MSENEAWARQRVAALVARLVRLLIRGVRL
jgi:hypothetical protein